MQTVDKYLPPINQPRGANDNRLSGAAIKNGARADGSVWIALAHLVATLSEKRALL
jgi:hypothetical protein